MLPAPVIGFFESFLAFFSFFMAHIFASHIFPRLTRFVY